MLTSNLVPCFVQTFKTDSKTGYEKALLVGVFDKITTDLDCCISSSSRDTGKTRQPVAVVMQEDGRLCEVNVSNVIIDDSYEVRPSDVPRSRRAQAGSVHPGQADGRRLLPLLRLRMGWTDLGAYRLWGHAGV